MWYEYLIAGFFGALVGSFLNVCIYRLPKGMSVVMPWSHCPNCKRRLKPWENVPIISFLFLKGKCSECKQKISLRYPLVESVSTALSIACYYHFAGLQYYAVYFLLLVAPLIVVFFIDLEQWIIPDIITIPGIFIGLIVRFSFSIEGEKIAHLIDGLIGAVVGGGFLLLVASVYERLRKREGLGGGDVKLMAMLGAFFGWQASIIILFLSSLVGVVFGVSLMIIKRKGLSMAMPYGPFLVTSGLIWLFFGQKFLNWYLYRLGGF